ncbi:MAG: hypothetical protein ACPG47_00770 [Leucothrix sp.]
MKKLPIKIITIGLLAMVVTACTSAYDYRKERLVVELDVPLGKTADVGKTGLSVMFDSVEQDSRCPINAKCLWEGVGIVNATIINAKGDRKPIKLSTINYEDFNNVEKVFGLDFELVGLLPKPIAGTKSKASEQLIKLKVD